MFTKSPLRTQPHRKLVLVAYPLRTIVHFDLSSCLWKLRAGATSATGNCGARHTKSRGHCGHFQSYKYTCAFRFNTSASCSIFRPSCDYLISSQKMSTSTLSRRRDEMEDPDLRMHPRRISLRAPPPPNLVNCFPRHEISISVPI